MCEQSKFLNRDATARTPRENSERARIIQEILNAKTPYDEEFERTRQIFAPMLKAVDGANPRRVLFVDPLKSVEIRDIGISPGEFIQAESKDPLQAGYSPLLATMTPRVSTLMDSSGHNLAYVITPQSEFVDQVGGLIKGLTGEQICSYVNYHEFFHVMADKYAKDDGTVNMQQKNEMFADVGAMVEMIKRGAEPGIIDSIITFRKLPGMGTDHETGPALENLKEYIQKNGVDKLRNMNDKDVLNLDYQIAEASSTPFRYREAAAWDSVKSLFSPGAKSMPTSATALPKEWNPCKLLLEKALEIDGKVTPETLLHANNALQAEYRKCFLAGNPVYEQMMTGMEEAFARQLRATDYEAVNATRHTTLTAQDRTDIDLVKRTPIPIPVSAVQKPADSKPTM